MLCDISKINKLPNSIEYLSIKWFDSKDLLKIPNNVKILKINSIGKIDDRNIEIKWPENLETLSIKYIAEEDIQILPKRINKLIIRRCGISDRIVNQIRKRYNDKILIEEY